MKQREIFIEQNENITDKKAFHSENSIIHLITANNAKIKKKKIEYQRHIKILTKSSYHRKCKTLMGEGCGEI